MKLLLIVCSLLLCNAVHASKKGKKIVFDTSIGLEDDDIQYYDGEDPAVGSEEYYDDYRWVAVTSDGYQYEGTLEEAKELLSYDSTDEEEELTDDDDDEDEDEDNFNYERKRNINEEENYYEQNNFEQEMDAFEEVTKQKVIGKDTRKLVTNLNSFPYTAIGRIERGCTGTLVAPNVVLTAGHCVVKNKKWNKRLNFHRSKDCDNNQGTVMEFKRAFTLRAWYRRHSRSFDLAVIILKTRFATVMSMRVLRRRSLRRLGVNIAGYPVDKPGRCLWRSYCRIARVRRRQLHYTCDTYGGMSGSAIYRHQNGIRYIVGVHTFGKRTYNGGTRMTKPNLRAIRKWIRNNQSG